MHSLKELSSLALSAACACTSTASLGEFSTVSIQLYQGDVESPSVDCNVYLEAPGGCPSLDPRTSILVNGQRPDQSQWGDQGDCDQSPTFEFSFVSGGDAELVMEGNGHVDDVIVERGLAPRRFTPPPMPLTVPVGGSLQIGWSGVSGDVPAFQGALVNSVATPEVTVSPGTNGTSVTVAIPTSVAPGDYALELFAISTPIPSLCSGIASCSALVMVDAKYPIAVVQ
jgi:hypothetical protein